MGGWIDAYWLILLVDPGGEGGRPAGIHTVQGLHLLASQPATPFIICPLSVPPSWPPHGYAGFNFARRAVPFYQVYLKMNAHFLPLLRK